MSVAGGPEGPGTGGKVPIRELVGDRVLDVLLAQSKDEAGQLRLTGGGRLVALACRSGGGALLTPCGRCRQVLYELGGPDCLVDTPGGVRPMRELLPDAFGPADLA